MDNFPFIRDLFELLDARMEQLVAEIEASDDPDGFGLLDDAEHVFGMGLVAAQRYLTSVRGWHDISKNDALNSGPIHSGGQSFAKIINAAANYWKHIDEWDLGAVVHRDIDGLETFQSNTMRVIESVTPWADYTLANLLHALIGEPQLSLLLPILQQWREELLAQNVG